MKKKSTERAKINASVGPQSIGFINKIFERPTTGATHIIDAFPGLYNQTILEISGRFTRDECMLMIDVMNGTMLTATIAGQHLRTNVIDGCHYDNLDGKWGVDKEKLWHKLEAMTIFQKACVELWIQKFWVNYQKIKIEEYVKQICQ